MDSADRRLRRLKFLNDAYYIRWKEAYNLREVEIRGS